MAGFRVLRENTAFSNGSAGKGKKRPRENDRTHLDWIKTLPCVITGERPVDPAHIRYADRVYGKREVGKAEKPDDRWVVPLCRRLHDEQHSMSERIFWARYGLDPLRIALALHACTGDDDQALVILQEAWTVRKTFDTRQPDFNPSTGEVI
jgi:hypothetical protein